MYDNDYEDIACDECQSLEVSIWEDAGRKKLLNYYCRECGAEWVDHA